MKRMLKRIFIFSSIFSLFLVIGSCTKEQEDACLKSEAAQKVVNMRVYLQVATQSGVPVVDENVNINIAFFQCGSDIAKPEEAYSSWDLNGVTNEDGMLESEIANMVLSNTLDRVVVNGIAPNLDFYLQNYHREIFGYPDLQGAGLEEVYLYITKKNP